MRRLSHQTHGAMKNAVVGEDYAAFQTGARVQTADGFPGRVTAVLTGPYPQTETYEVRLDNGLGGGEYTARQLRPLTERTAAAEEPMAVEASEIHLASEDYPELGTILYDRPPNERVQVYAGLQATAVRPAEQIPPPSACSWCGHDQFTNPTNTGRGLRMECAQCGGTMTSWGGQWQPDMTSSPENHPSRDADSRAVIDDPTTVHSSLKAEGGQRETWNILMGRAPDDDGDAPLREPVKVNHQVEDIDDRAYTVRDVDRANAEGGLDTALELRGHKRDPARATFRLQHVPVDSLRIHRRRGDRIVKAKPFTTREMENSGDDYDESERERLDSIRQGYDHNPEAMPPIVVIKHGPHHVILDGSHRAGVAIENGSTHIPAFVTDHESFAHEGALTADSWDHWLASETIASRQNFGERVMARYDLLNTGDPTAAAVAVNPGGDPVGYLRGLATQANYDPDLGFHLIATWAEVREKAKQIKDSGGVRILAASAQGVVGEVQGEHALYESAFNYVPGTRKLADWNCFLPDAPVMMADGTEKPISQVKPGNMVITHTGHIQRVVRAKPKPFEGEIIRVQPEGDFRELVATSEHEVLVGNRDSYLVGRGRDVLYRHTGSTIPELVPFRGWRKIGQLVAGDYLTRPVVRDEHPLVVSVPRPPLRPVASASGVRGVRLFTNRQSGQSYWIFKFCEGGRTGTPTTQYFKSRDEAVAASDDYYAQRAYLDVKVDEELAYWLGWYTAEGFLVKTPYQVGFSLSADERWVAEQLDDIAWRKFGVRGSIRNIDNKIDYRISSFVLYYLASHLVGSSAKTKSLSASILTLPEDEHQRFLDGWLLGDGCVDKNGQHLISTANLVLVYQAREMLTRMGFSVGVYRTLDNSGGLSTTRNAGPIYTVRWMTKGDRISQYRAEGLVWQRIRSISRESYVGDVWDIEVEEDHSFRAYGYNVHNCGCKWGAYAWGRSPAYRRFEGRKCSHVTALQFEAQSRGMFGQDVGEDRHRLPGQYQRSPVTVQYERPTERADGGNLNRRSVPPGNMRRTFSSTAATDLDLAPVHVFAREMAQAGDTSDAVFRMLANHGVAQDNALRIVRWAVTGDDDGGSTQPGEDIPGITTRDTTEFKKKPHHHDHHTNDTRRHAPDFGRGIGWYAPGLMWCDQCNGSGCGHCGGSGQVMQNVSPTGGPGVGDLSTTTSPIADEDADAGEDVSGGISTAGALEADVPVQDGTWYHGSRHTLQPGQILTGGHAKSNQGYGQPGEHVYYTGRHDVASAFAEAGNGPDHRPDAQPKVYLVEPVEGHEPDPDEPEEAHSYRARSVRVLNQVRYDSDAPRRIFGSHQVAPVTATLQQHQWLLQHYADASTTLMGGNPAPASNPLTPHSDSRNPGSTGWGTSADPHAWTHPIINNSYEISAEAGLHTGGAEGQPSLPDYTHAGVAVKAADTGRVLMIQRSFKDDKDPAKGTWEFPGGGKEEGDQTSLHTGIREWQEEVGQPFPEGGHVSHTWRAGTYHGHVVTIPTEDQVDFSNGRSTVNPDDPDGDDHEQAAWWDPQHAQKNPALRQELKKDNPFGAIEKAAAFLTMDQVLEVARAEERRTGKSSEQLLREHVAWQEQQLADWSRNGSVTAADSVRGNPEFGTYKAATSVPTTTHSSTRDDIESVSSLSVIAGNYSEALNTRRHWHDDAAQRGHAMKWTRGSSGDKPEDWFLGECKHCGATITAGPHWNSSYTPLRDGREVHCTGPGTKWQSDMERELSLKRFQDAFSQFRQDIKDGQDREWLHGQGIEAALHDQPEPALPSTDGTVEDDPQSDIGAMGWSPGDPAPGQYLSAQPDIPWGYPGGASEPPPLQLSSSLDDVPLDQLVAAFQSTAMGRQLASDAATAPPTEMAVGGGRPQQGAPPPEIQAENAQLAAIARAVLAGEVEIGEDGISKSAMKNFDLAEQQELITEGADDGTRARNFGGLQIEGTHYALVDDPEMAGWM